MRIPIRTKLAAALAVPLVALVGGAAYEVVRASDEATDATASAAGVAAESELATAAVGPGSLISTLQLERNITGVEQLGLQGTLELPVASSAEARQATDVAADELRAFVADRGPQVQASFAGALAAIDDLQQLRAQVDSSTIAPGLGNAAFANQVFDGYTAVIGSILDDAAGIALDIDDAELRNGVELVALSTQAYELRSQIVSQIILPLLVNDQSVGARTNVAQLVAESDRVDAELLARSNGRYAGLAESAIELPRVQGEDAMFDAYVANGTADLVELAAQVSATGDNGFIGLREQASAALADTAASLEASARSTASQAQDRRQLVLFAGGAAALLALVVSALASRSITRPLRSLTGQARSMADEHLPAAVQRVLETPLGEDVVVPELAPIRVRTRDEVADVAAALTTVQGSALDLAVEQAVLRRNIADSFVNMSRRNQNLLDRQLDSITELEREETDPERLTGLFRLDHLATRMRRNAESLLRLAGGGSTGGWSGPVPVVDLVRSALGEVEDYQRVDIRSLEPVTFVGSAGTDIAHALAELVENALAFSPPGESVEVRGRRSGDGYVLAVVDNGVGMTADQLEAANRRLAGQESFTVAPSRYLGHYVAGHLATTHGIRIQLQATPAGGITACIDLPARLLTEDATASPAPAAEPAAPAAAPVAEPPAPAAEPSRDAAFDDLASWLVPVPSDASSLTPDIPPAESPAVTSSPEPAPGEAEPAPGFGGLAARSTAQPAAGTTASGLVKRVRGAQEPGTSPFASPAVGHAGDPAAPTVAGPTSAEEVGDFFSAFSSGVERGLADSTSTEWDASPQDGEAW